jgi:ParB family chromosome partitioning protein
MLLRNKSGPMEIPIDSIVISPDQPRKTFSNQELEELSNSIREFGVFRPCDAHPQSF